MLGSQYPPLMSLGVLFVGASLVIFGNYLVVGTPPKSSCLQFPLGRAVTGHFNGRVAVQLDQVSS